MLTDMVKPDPGEKQDVTTQGEMVPLSEESVLTKNKDWKRAKLAHVMKKCMYRIEVARIVTVLFISE